jgi:hypothetical protein
VPQGFKSLALTYVSSNVTTLAWRQPTDVGGCLVLGYQIMQDDGQGGDFTSAGAELTASTFTYNVTGLTLG